MIVSHERKFILFVDPLGAGQAVADSLSPWVDSDLRGGGKDHFRPDMSPNEAEWAFDASGLAFRSYARIALVEHPFTRIARLFDRIQTQDRLWRLRQTSGLLPPKFNSWLSSITPNGRGAAGRRGPAWRRFGAWSAKCWMADLINYPIRLEYLEQDLTPVLSELGIAPALDYAPHSVYEGWEDLFDARATRLMHSRYSWDMAQFDYSFQPVQTAA